MVWVQGDRPKTFRREEEVFLKGIFKWTKHLRPDMTFPPGKWSTNIYLEGTELEKFREWQADGIKNNLKKDEDGWYAALNRKCSIETKGGKIVGLEPPFVFREENGNKIPITDLVGNGSTGIAKCILWEFNPTPQIKGKALRWESLRIDNLVPYSPANDFPDQGESLKTYDKQEALF